MGKSSASGVAPRPSENLHEALEACSPDSSSHEYISGPWDELASWYWGYYNEINHDLARQVADDRIPPKPLCDTLISLYFKHVHSLCPIFDEVEFHTCYYQDNDDMAFLNVVSLLEFQAMMFAASLHLNNLQIRNTRYQSTYQCHKSLFEAADMTYHACQDGPPIVLTRAAILLSYWSPYTAEEHTNSYWIDRAFFHAHAGKLHEEHKLLTSLVTPGRRKLIWWCCLLRDRLVAFGLRRTQRLHQEPLSYSLPTLEDFGVEAQCPNFLDNSFKMLCINNFIAQCKLSIVMAKILKFVKERAPVTVADGAEKPRYSFNNTELDKVTLLHLELIDWNKQFQKSLDQVPRSMPNTCIMPCQMTSLHYRSAVASLYLPYTSPVSRLADKNSNFHNVAFLHVKEAVSHIAKSIEMLAYNVESNDIPCSIGAWISFPIAVKMIFLRNSTHLEDPAAELREMCSLMDLLCLLKDRFSGGQFISNILDAVMSQAFLVRGTGDRQEISRLLQDAESTIDRGLAYGVVPNAKL